MAYGDQQPEEPPPAWQPIVAITVLFAGLLLAPLGFLLAGPLSGATPSAPLQWIVLGAGLLLSGVAASFLFLRAARPAEPLPAVSPRPVASSPSRFPDEDIVQDGELTQELLGTNSALSRLVFESMAEGVIVTDVHDRVLVFNATARKVFGTEAIGIPTTEWPRRFGVHLHDAKTLCPALEFPLVRATRGEPVREVELFIRPKGAKDGAWISGGSHPLEDEDGRVRGGLMVFREVTTRKRVEAALKSERARLRRQHQRQAAMAEIEVSIVEAHELRTLLDRVSEVAHELLPTAAACVTLWDPDVHELASSSSAVQDREFEGAPHLMREHEGAKRWILEHKQPLTVSNIDDDPFGPHPLPPQFGLRSYAGVPLLDEGRVTGVLFALDREPRIYAQEDLDFLMALASRAATAITKVRLYEHLKSTNATLETRSAELEENERRFRMLADTAPVLIWMSDKDKRCVYFNQPRLEFSGRTIEEESGNGWMEVVHPDDFEHCFRTYDGAFDARESFRMEYRLRRADGEYRWMLDSGTPRFAPTGEFLGYIGSSIDITDRRESEAELTRHRERLEELVQERTAEVEESHRQLQVADRLAAIGTLTAGLGHDMNNVLFPVRCRLDALDWNAIPDDLCDAFKAVSHAVEYLQQLTDGLRLFALDPQDGQASAELTDLEVWWTQVSPLLQKSRPKNVQFEGELAPGLPQVRVAPHRLTQAVLNLVVNAGESMPDGGRIRVTAGVSDDGQFIRIGVSDEGHGMSEEVRRQAFNPFFTTKTRGMSTGLGLSLVHSVVKSSRGTVDVESNEGRGTTITLSFPAVGRTAPSRRKESPGTEMGVASVSVSDPRVAAWATGLLRSAGFQIEQPDSERTGHGQVWVTDSATSEPEEVRNFLESNPRCRVVVFGPASAEWSELGVTVVEEKHDLDALQDALRAVVFPKTGVDA